MMTSTLKYKLFFFPESPKTVAIVVADYEREHTVKMVTDVSQRVRKEGIKRARKAQKGVG